MALCISTSAFDTSVPVHLRAAALLQRIGKATVARDGKVAELRAALDQTEKVEEWIEAIEEANSRQVPALVGSGSALASRVGDAAKEAEQCTAEVKRLMRLNERAQSALAIVSNVMKQRDSVATVSAAIDRRDFKTAGKCIRQYDEVMEQLQGSEFAHFSSPLRASGTHNGVDDAGERDWVNVSNGSEGDGSLPSGEKPSPEEVMRSARSLLEGMVTTELHGATSRATVAELTNVLVDMGKPTQGFDTYMEWVAAKVKSEIDELVDAELLRMDDSNSNSHLWLVTKVLDHVVAAVEKEEEHVKSVFGDAFVTPLLRKLHVVSTNASDRIVNDFLRKRNLFPAAAGSKSPGAGPAASPVADPSALRSPPKVIDGVLEDIAHLIACYHIYLTFVENKAASSAAPTAQQQQAGSSSKGGPTPAQSASAAAWLQDPTLTASIEQLLKVYSTLQREYLASVFAVSYEAVAKAFDKPAEESSTGVFGALTAAFSSSSAKEKEKEEKEKKGSRGRGSATPGTPTTPGRGPSTAGAARADRVEMNFVDDVFHLALLSLRRALQTKSVYLVKSTIADVTALVGTRLFESIQRRLQFSTGSTASPSGLCQKALCWVDPAARAAGYVVRLSDEVTRLAAATFEQSQDRERLAEATRKLRETADLFTDAQKSTVKRAAAAALNTSLKADVAPKLNALPYVLGEQGLSAAELNDPWVQAACRLWSTALDEQCQGLSREGADLFVAYFADGVAQVLEDVARQKEFDQFGALQFDKEIRAIREFLNERVDTPLRDRFARLNCIAAVLVVDAAKDALEWHTALPAGTQQRFSLQDVVNFLQRRVDISDEHIRKAVDALRQ